MANTSGDPAGREGWPGLPRPRRWWPDLLALAVLALITVGLAHGTGLGVDVAVSRWCDAHRPAALYWLARALFLLGQSWFVTYPVLGLAIIVAWRRRVPGPLLRVAGAFVLTFVTLTVFKVFTDRAAPSAGHLAHPVLHPERFGSGGVSYPSGHLANALVWYGVLAALLVGVLAPRWLRLVRWVPAAILSVVATYVGFHWLSDTVAGLLLGVVLDRLMRRVTWDRWDASVGRHH